MIINCLTPRIKLFSVKLFSFFTSSEQKIPPCVNFGIFGLWKSNCSGILPRPPVVPPKLVRRMLRYFVHVHLIKQTKFLAELPIKSLPNSKQIGTIYNLMATDGIVFNTVSGWWFPANFFLVNCLNHQLNICVRQVPRPLVNNRHLGQRSGYLKSR